MASFFSSSGFPPFSWPAVLSFYLLRIALLAAPARVRARPFFLSTCYALRRAPRSPACTHARWCTRRRPTDERRDVRSAGVADWKTARGGNTERTLTAAAGPSPCDPYRHALAMRPSLKVRPFSFLNYYILAAREKTHKKAFFLCSVRSPHRTTKPSRGRLRVVGLKTNTNFPACK